MRASFICLPRAVRTRTVADGQKVREAEHPARAIRDAVIGAARHTDDVAILTVRWDAVRLVRA
jgi:ethanolamine utilization protein EutA (predicted chaperonin)